jgi:hypothetical protein
MINIDMASPSQKVVDFGEVEGHSIPKSSNEQNGFTAYTITQALDLQRIIHSHAIPYTCIDGNKLES